MLRQWKKRFLISLSHFNNCTRLRLTRNTIFEQDGLRLTRNTIFEQDGINKCNLLRIIFSAI